MNTFEIRDHVVAAALAACPTLRHNSASRDALWLAVQEVICTKGRRDVIPLGSSSPVSVSSEHATTELLAAMEWLTGHEAEARELTPRGLYIKLRGVATRGADGSARAAQADALCGLTNVSPGDPVRFSPTDPFEVAS